VAWRHARAPAVSHIRWGHSCCQAPRRTPRSRYLALYRSAALVGRPAQAGAVARSYSWRELLAELGLAGRNADERTRVKAHAMRRGLDLSHLQEPKAAGTAVVLTPDVKWLRDAGAAIAATWFLIRGCNASIPICWSPCRRELSEFRLRPRLIVRTAGKFKWAGGLIRRGTEAHYFPTTPTRWFFFLHHRRRPHHVSISYPVGFSPGACRSSCAPTPSSSSVILMAL
jgi:hypothetical protein